MSVAEVTTYVNKVINYEFNAYKANWAKRALLVATHDWVHDACNTKEQVAASLSGYSFTKLYEAGNPCLVTSTPNAANVNAAFNNGVGFANYIGHGNNLAWAGVYGVGRYGRAKQWQYAADHLFRRLRYRHVRHAATL